MWTIISPDILQSRPVSCSGSCVKRQSIRRSSASNSPCSNSLMSVAVHDLPRDDVRVRTQSVAITEAWHARAVVLAATCVMVGVYWDISWHMTIGRDTFWTPAHLLIQAGGLIAGISSAYVALRTTFAGTEAQRAASV